MFERYTEKARRVIFFARYEATQFGSPEITTEHLLLALFREAPELKNLVPKLDPEKARREIEEQTAAGNPIPTSRDLPLNQSAKRVLAYAAEEAERLGHKHIGCEHLLLALSREKDTLAAQILRKHGFVMAKARVEFARTVQRQVSEQDWVRLVTQPEAEAWAVLFQWEKRRCEPRDALRNPVNQRVSLYHGESYDQARFEVVKGGWVYFRCAICGNNMYVAEDPTGSIGYTNRQDWICPSCYERFAAPVSEDKDDES